MQRRTFVLAFIFFQDGLIGSDSRVVGDSDSEKILDANPETLQPWYGASYDFLGSGIKYKEILFVKIQIYEVSLYVEEKSIRDEFLRLTQTGFFVKKDVKTLCKALLNGKFNKLLQIRLLRTVTPSQLTGEIGRDLKPRLAKSGNLDLWQRFVDYVDGKSLSRGSKFLALIHEDGVTDGGIFPPGFDDWQHAVPELKDPGQAFGQALLDMYLGASPLVPDAKEKWGKAAMAYLPSKTSVKK